LRDVVIIQVDEAFEGCLEEGGRVEAVGTQDIGNAAIEAFDHAIGLMTSGLDLAVFDTVIGADPIKGGQAPVGRRSPVAQKRSVNALPLSVRTLLMMKGALSIRHLRKPPAEVAGFRRTDPAGCAINGGKEIRALVRVRHLRQIA